MHVLFFCLFPQKCWERAGYSSAHRGKVYYTKVLLSVTEEDTRCPKEIWTVGPNSSGPNLGVPVRKCLGDRLRLQWRTHPCWVWQVCKKYGNVFKPKIPFRSLERLQLSYVDIIQVHDFEFAQDPARIALKVLPVLKQIVASGRARWGWLKWSARWLA